MDNNLPVYPEQALQSIKELNAKAIEYGKRIIDYGDVDEIDHEIARINLDNAILSFIVLLEQYPDNHGTLLEQTRNLLAESRKDPVKTEVLLGEPYLIWPFRLRELVDMFSSLHVPEKKTESDKDIDSLVKVIKRSEYYITQTNIFKSVPRSETDVHARIEGLLKCLYSDVDTKQRVSKALKGFEPDTAIPSLKVFIEYKYITNKKQGKKIIDEILADMSGYQSPDYENFIFIIYENRRVFLDADWDRMIKSCKPQNRIDCVVIKGVVSSKKAKS